MCIFDGNSTANEIVQLYIFNYTYFTHGQQGYTPHSALKLSPYVLKMCSLK